MMGALIDKVLQVADAQLGVREIGGNNRGRRVEEYLSATNTPPGSAWCASFVAYCMREAGVSLGQDGWPKTAWTPAIEEWAKKHGVLKTKPKRGDVFLLCDAQGPFHTGFVEQEGIDGIIVTVEGNTNDGGSADGDGVFRRHRRRDGSILYVRWGDVLEVNKKPSVIKIFRKPSRAVVVIDGMEHECFSLSINGSPPAAGAEISILAEYSP